jgi:regulation of enolase protein 1 (concanavalin A-like superfamily)
VITGQWLNPPPASAQDGSALLVTAGKGSDFWRTTSYGYDRDSGHALLSPLGPEAAIEVSFIADYDHQFDQAGILVRLDEETWIKAGVEYCDGALQLGAVVTHRVSDWSSSPVPWQGREVTLRASRSGDAVTIRARADSDPWQMIRLAPFPPAADATAGPYCCAPERDGLTVRFTHVSAGPPDETLHT